MLAKLSNYSPSFHQLERRHGVELGESYMTTKTQLDRLQVHIIAMSQRNGFVNTIFSRISTSLVFSWMAWQCGIRWYHGLL